MEGRRRLSRLTKGTRRSMTLIGSSAGAATTARPTRSAGSLRSSRPACSATWPSSSSSRTSSAATGSTRSPTTSARLIACKLADCSSDQRSALEQRVRTAIRQAYGVERAAPETIDTSHGIEERIQSLRPGLVGADPDRRDARRRVQRTARAAVRPPVPAAPADRHAVPPSEPAGGARGDPSGGSASGRADRGADRTPQGHARDRNPARARDPARSAVRARD